MEKSEAQSDNSSDNTTAGTEKSDSDTGVTENVGKSNKVSDTKPTERDPTCFDVQVLKRSSPEIDSNV